MMEQTMQNLLQQKQQVQSELMEIESAQNGLKDSQQSYKIIGNIMVSKSKEELEKELKQKEQRDNIKIKSYEKQEEQLREKIKVIQDKVLKQMK